MDIWKKGGLVVVVLLVLIFLSSVVFLFFSGTISGAVIGLPEEGSIEQENLPEAGTDSADTPVDELTIELPNEPEDEQKSSKTDGSQEDDGERAEETNREKGVDDLLVDSTIKSRVKGSLSQTDSEIEDLLILPVPKVVSSGEITLTADEMCTTNLTACQKSGWVNNTVYCITSDILNQAGTCMGLDYAVGRITFDCRGHNITGDNSGTDYGFNITTARNITIKNCKVGRFANGINILDSYNFSVYNTVLFSNTNDGAYFSASENITLKYSNFSTNTVSGVEFDGSNSFTVKYSIFDENSVYGLKASASPATFGMIFNNTFQNQNGSANDAGLYLSDGNQYWNISYNNFSSNWYGISIDSSLNAPKVFKNYFDHNAVSTDFSAGINLDGDSYGYYIDNIFRENTYGVRISIGTSSINSHNEFYNNQFNDSIVAAIGFGTWTSLDQTFIGNVIDSQVYHHCFNNDSWSLTNFMTNASRTTNYGSINLFGCDHAYLKNVTVINNLVGTTGGGGFGVFNATNVTVLNVNFSFNYIGAYIGENNALASTIDFNFSHSTARANILDGLYLRYAINATVFNSTIANNTDDGIEIADCTNFTLMNSIISTNSDDGLTVSGTTSTSALILNNTFQYQRNSANDAAIVFETTSTNAGWNISYNNFSYNYHGIYLKGTPTPNALQVFKNYFDHTAVSTATSPSSAIYLTSEREGVYIDNVFRNSTYGIWLNGALNTDNKFYNNQFNDTVRAPIRFEQWNAVDQDFIGNQIDGQVYRHCYHNNSWSLSDFKINVSKATNYGSIVIWGCKHAYVENVTAINNQIPTDNDGAGIGVFNSSNVTIKNSNFSLNYGNVLVGENDADAKVDRFNFSHSTVFAAVTDGMLIRFSNNVSLFNSTFLNNGDDGVDLRDSQNFTLIYSTLSGNTDNGLETSEDSTGNDIAWIFNNTFSFQNGATDMGLYLYRGNDLWNISHNNFSSNTVGFYSDGTTTANTPKLFRNRFENSGTEAIYINNDDSGIYTGNTFYENVNGIEIANTNANSNLFYRNNFYNLTGAVGFHATAVDNDSQFNLTIGNYWDNYDDSTEFCFDVAPENGFCDSPYYKLGGGALDNVPFKYPVIFEDLLAPTFSSALSTSVNFQQTQNFTASINITDDQQLTKYIFGTNASGAWVNRTFAAFGLITVNASWQANISAPAGDHIGWLYYANDSFNNRAQSDYFSFIINVSGDLVAPTFSSALNTSVNFEQNQNFTASVNITDETLLSGYIFGTNASGSWVNGSYLTAVTDINASFQANITFPSGSHVGWIYYANDSSNNKAQSENYYLIVNANSTLNNAPTFGAALNTSINFEQNQNFTASIIIEDDNLLKSWTFGTNASGSWVNRTFLNSSVFFNASIQANITGATARWHVGWNFYANDSANNRNQSEERFFIANASTVVPPPDYGPEGGHGGGSSSGSGSSENVPLLPTEEPIVEVVNSIKQQSNQFYSGETAPDHLCYIANEIIICPKEWGLICPNGYYPIPAGGLYECIGSCFGGISPLESYSSSCYDPCLGIYPLFGSTDQCYNINTEGIITIIAEVINNNGRTATLSDFTFSVNERVVEPDVPTKFTPGTYQVSPSGPTKYSTTYSGDCDHEGIISLAAGQNLVCNVVIDDFLYNATVLMHGFTLRNAGPYTEEKGYPEGSGKILPADIDGKFRKAEVSGYPESACNPVIITVENTADESKDFSFAPFYEYNHYGYIVYNNFEVMTTKLINPLTATNLNQFTFTHESVSKITSFPTRSGGTIPVTVKGPYSHTHRDNPIGITERERHYRFFLHNVPPGEQVYMMFCGRLGLHAFQNVDTDRRVRIVLPEGIENSQRISMLKTAPSPLLPADGNQTIDRIKGSLSERRIISSTERSIIGGEGRGTGLSLGLDKISSKLFLQNEQDVNEIRTIRKFKVILKNTGLKKMKLFPQIFQEIDDPYFILTRKTLGHSESRLKDVAQIAYSPNSVTEDLLEAEILNPEEVILEPGESIEKEILVREGLANQKVFKMQFVTEGVVVQEQDFPIIEKVFTGTAFGVDKDKSQLEAYAFIVPPEPIPEFEKFHQLQLTGLTGETVTDLILLENTYYLELSLENKEPALRTGNFFQRLYRKYFQKDTLFVELYGPYHLNKNQVFIFAQQFDYNPKKFQGEFVAKAKILKGDKLYVESKFDLEFS